MKKLITVIVISFFLFFAAVQSASASAPVVSSSAQLKKAKQQTRIDFRVIKLRRFLQKHNSPLAPYSGEFVWYADKYSLDWRLVPAITGVESTFGKRIPYNSHNAYGWANGNYYFGSWEESIGIVSKTLRKKYYNRGASSIEEISRIYAPPSDSWSWKVEYFMNEIDPIPVVFSI